MSQNLRTNPDFATLAGVLIAAFSIAGGLVYEGGSIRDIAQITAALMVVGGTLGAVLISTPLKLFFSALCSVRLLIFDRPAPMDELVGQLIQLSSRARKTGIASLENEVPAIEDSFLSKAVGLAADRTPLAEIRSMMELELNLEESRLYAEAKVFETAGGYAPTVGIIGAVLGLIQVMKHLENIDEVGRGIAVSFVATVYGVALANLIFLPAAAKLKCRAAQIVDYRECALEGVAGIVESLNTSLLGMKLAPYLPQRKALGISRPRRQPAPAPVIA